ncbi:MAG: hypothetical protein QOF95_26 [Pseudonocardiales bacterium]|nr:hypothetical protein [Pseudonocardiales bacterium]
MPPGSSLTFGPTPLDAIIVNDNITGPTTIDIAPSDFAFKSSGGCDWVRVG